MKMSVVALALLLAQAATSGPAFEVASIKRNTSATLNSGMVNQPGGRVMVINMSLRQLVRGMYRLPDYQFVNNAGDWLSNERWDIAAKAEGDPPFEQLVLMVRALVTERFSLATHQERRDMPIYALVLARPNGAPGPALLKSTKDCSVPNTANPTTSPFSSATSGGGSSECKRRPRHIADRSSGLSPSRYASGMTPRYASCQART